MIMTASVAIRRWWRWPLVVAGTVMIVSVLPGCEALRALGMGDVDLDADTRTALGDAIAGDDPEALNRAFELAATDAAGDLLRPLMTWLGVLFPSAALFYPVVWRPTRKKIEGIKVALAPSPPP